MHASFSFFFLSAMHKHARTRRVGVQFAPPPPPPPLSPRSRWRGPPHASNAHDLVCTGIILCHDHYSVDVALALGIGVLLTSNPQLVGAVSTIQHVFRHAVPVPRCTALVTAVLPPLPHSTLLQDGLWQPVSPVKDAAVVQYHCLHGTHSDPPPHAPCVCVCVCARRATGLRCFPAAAS